MTTKSSASILESNTNFLLTHIIKKRNFWLALGSLLLFIGLASYDYQIIKHRESTNFLPLWSGSIVITCVGILIIARNTRMTWEKRCKMITWICWIGILITGICTPQGEAIATLPMIPLGIAIALNDGLLHTVNLRAFMQGDNPILGIITLTYFILWIFVYIRAPYSSRRTLYTILYILILVSMLTIKGCGKLAYIS